MVKNSNSGFSLIELLVVITIMAFFFGLSIGLYGRFSAQKKLEAETNRFAKTLETARQKMLSGDRVGISSSCAVTGYKVVYGTANYSLYAVCSSDEIIGKQVNLESGLTINASGQIQFAADGSVNGAACVIIQSSGDGKCRIVTVSQAGVIETSDELTSCVCA